MRHLNEAELEKIYTEGPEKLFEHSDEFAHMHIVHEKCVLCVVKLLNLVADRGSMAMSALNN